MLKLILLMLFLPNNKGDNIKYQSILNDVMGKKHCIKLFSGNRKCLQLYREHVFILPYMDTLELPTYLKGSSKDKDFMPLEENELVVLDSINSSFGKSFELNTQGNSAFTKNREDATMIISFTRFLKVGGKQYCLVQVRKKYEIWILKYCLYNNKKRRDIQVYVP